MTSPESHRTGGAMRVADLYCCQGGAARGYQMAGAHVTGFDISPQPRYIGDAFEQRDVLAITAEELCERFDFIHASPPCQAHSLAQRIQNRAHPDLIEQTRALLIDTGLPYVIENVEGAPLIDPITLCGAMFPGLSVYRHRLFESNFPLVAPNHPPHVAPLRKMGRPPREGDFMHVVGNFSGVAAAKAAMGGLDWMNRDGLRESIPPAFTKWIGEQLAAHLFSQPQRSAA